MAASWRVLPEWPYPRVDRMSASLFRTNWDRSLKKLEDEVVKSGGSDVVIGCVMTSDQLSYAGVPKPRFKVLYRGVEVSFEREGQRLAFHTDKFPLIHDNVHAIALTLEALRAIDRYGATSGAEQYAGFAMLGSGQTDGAAERGRQLVEAAGGIRAALKKHHPDHGGDVREFADVEAFRKSVGA